MTWNLERENALQLKWEAQIDAGKQIWYLQVVGYFDSDFLSFCLFPTPAYHTCRQCRASQDGTCKPGEPEYFRRVQAATVDVLQIQRRGHLGSHTTSDGDLHANHPGPFSARYVRGSYAAH